MTQTRTASQLFDLTGRVAIVTGGTSGIGLACVQVLASAGATVITASLPAEHPDDVATMERATGLRVDGIECDVTSGADLERLVRGTTDRYGRIDIVVANAGIALDTGPHTVGTDAQLDRMFDVHVRSVIKLANLALPVMADSGGGAFIIMSSLSGVRGNRILGQYGVTKAANAQLARNLAVQWGARNVRVNAISPGVIRTAFAEPITANEDAAAVRLSKTPLGRFGEPDHVAGTALWLASEAGAFTSGQNIIVDGGTVVSD